MKEPTDAIRMLESPRPVNKGSSAQTQAVPVPMLDLRRQYAAIREEVLAAIERVCESQQFVLGDEVARFEAEAAAFLGARRAVGCASGTDALWLALLGVGVQPGEAVITTPFSFFATVSAIVRAGARPVLADVDPETLNLDPALVTRVLQGAPEVHTLLPVHLYGQCADMDALTAISQAHGLKIVEDAAQAFGASWNGRVAGTLGDAAAFSFYPTKNLSAYGDAGCVVTNDEPTAEHVTRLRNHGSRQRYLHEEIGANSRLAGIQAAVLRVKLNHLKSWNEARRERARTYDSLFEAAGLSRAAQGDSASVRPLQRKASAYHIFHQYVVRVQRRDAVRAFLREKGIATEVYYPIPLHLQPCFAYLGYREGDFPVAEQAARETLALPMFPELTADEQQRVVGAIADFYS